MKGRYTSTRCLYCYKDFRCLAINDIYTCGHSHGARKTRDPRRAQARAFLSGRKRAKSATEHISEPLSDRPQRPQAYQCSHEGLSHCRLGKSALPAAFCRHPSTHSRGGEKAQDKPARRARTSCSQRLFKPADELCNPRSRAGDAEHMWPRPSPPIPSQGVLKARRGHA